MERICFKTEFEVEGWRKFPPVTYLLEKYAPESIKKLKLELRPISISNDCQVDCKENCQLHLSSNIENSNIYMHLKQEKSSKLAVYVNQIFPINQDFFNGEEFYDINNVSYYHCSEFSAIRNGDNLKIKLS